MIFGAIIDENLKDEIKVTVIATGFEHRRQLRHSEVCCRHPADKAEKLARPAAIVAQAKPFGTQPSSDQLDIPAFLRNRT